MAVFEELADEYDLRTLFQMLDFDTVCDGLESNFGIKVRRYEDLAVLNYSQIDSPKTHHLVRECRGTIVKRVEMPVGTRGEVVCAAYNRFFNWGEAQDIADYERFDLDNVVVKNKMDGSLIKVWFDESIQTWEFATRGTAFGEAVMMDGREFCQAIAEDVFHVSGIYEPDFQQALKEVLDSDYTYLFEFVSPLNQIVTFYVYAKLFLLDAVHNELGFEIPSHHKCNYCSTVKRNKHLDNVTHALADIADNNQKPTSQWDVPIARVHLVNAHSLSGSTEQIAEWLDHMHPTDEGFVAHDVKSGVRFKFKNEDYVHLHHLRGEGTPTLKRVMAMVQSKEYDEICTYLAVLAPLLREVHGAVESALSTMEADFNAFNQIEYQKAFAMNVKDRYSGPLTSLFFEARKKGTTITGQFDTINSDKTLERVARSMPGVEDAYQRGLNKMIQQSEHNAQEET